MAEVTKIVCDYETGSKQVEGRTVQFSIGEEEFEGDMCQGHELGLRESMQPFIDQARRKRAKRRASSARKPAKRTRKTTKRTARRNAGPKTESGKIRAWAKRKGIKVNAKGRIPYEVREAYRKDPSK